MQAAAATHPTESLHRVPCRPPAALPGLSSVGHRCASSLPLPGAGGSMPARSAGLKTALNSACRPAAVLSENRPATATRLVRMRSAANQTATIATPTVLKTDRLSSVTRSAVAHSADLDCSAPSAPSAAAVVPPRAAASPAASVPGNSAADYAADLPSPPAA